MVVLDTHAWLWWVADPDRLSTTARAAIDQAHAIGVASISAWEVTMLVERGRIRLDRPVARWIRDALQVDPRVAEVPLTVRIAVAAAELQSDGLHGDPADRFLLASARDQRAKLVTRDQALRSFDPAGTVW